MKPWNSSAAFTAVSAVIFLIVTVFLFVPALLYYGNGAEFDYSFRSALPWLLVLGTAAALPLIAIAFMLRGAVLKAYAGAIAFAGLFALVSAVYIVPDLGLLNGTKLEFDRTWAYLPWEAGAALTIIMLVSVAVRRAPKRLGGAFLALSTTAAVLVVGHTLWQPRSALDAPDRSVVFSVSSEKNLLLVLLDSFQSDVFRDLISQRRDLSASFDGFTYFPNTLGVASTTYLSLPSIHAGVEYQQDEPLGTYFESAVKRSFLSALATNDYDATLLNPVRTICPPDLKVCAFASSVLDDNSTRYLARAARLLDLSIFRSVPLLLKRATYRSGNGLISTFFGTSEASHHNVEGIQLMKGFGARLEVNSAKPTAKFLHVMSPHLPVVLDEACDFLPKPRPFTRETFSVQARCVLEGFASILAALKAKGVYDQTAIVLLADHGVSLPSTFAPKDADALWSGLVGSANPLFAIKPLGARGKLKVSNAAVHLPDVPATICDMMNACAAPSGLSALDLSEKARERLFNQYDWKNSYWTAPKIPIKQHFVSSPVWERSSWSNTVAEYQAGTPIDFTSGGNAEQYVGPGFSLAEGFGRWTDGDTAALTLRWTEAAPKGIDLTMNARGHVPGPSHDLEVRVLANGQTVGEIKYDIESVVQETTLRIPHNALRPSGLLSLQFVITGAASPQDLGISTDTRKLGLGLHWLKLSPAR